jgi:hypothetical protein
MDREAAFGQGLNRLSKALRRQICKLMHYWTNRARWQKRGRPLWLGQIGRLRRPLSAATDRQGLHGGAAGAYLQSRKFVRATLRPASQRQYRSSKTQSTQKSRPKAAAGFKNGQLGQYLFR